MFKVRSDSSLTPSAIGRASAGRQLCRCKVLAMPAGPQGCRASEAQWQHAHGEFPSDASTETLLAKTLAQIETQIAVLRKEADALKAKEMISVIERIKDAVGHYS